MDSPFSITVNLVEAFAMKGLQHFMFTLRNSRMNDYIEQSRDECTTKSALFRLI